MNPQYHILNGDALKSQFPESIKGERIVMRECLVDGDVQGKTFDEFFNTRAKFIQNTYSDSDSEYKDNVLPEFQKMKSINAASDVNLWFEDDLFCQVNFWFIVHYLNALSISEFNIYLIRPEVHNQYGFGGLTSNELIEIFSNRKKLKDIESISKLWKAFQVGELQDLKSISLKLSENYPFIQDAVHAHLERLPSCNNPGRPKNSLVKIMEDLGTKEFGPVFQEFSQRESIYGFGDVQVRRLYNEVLNKK